MKIIYGITKSNFGGAQRYVFDLATAAKAAGHDVSVICGAGGVLVDRLKNSGIKVYEMENMKRDLSLLDEIRSFHFIFRTLMEEKPDVFHTNSSKMGGLGNLAALIVGVKKIIFTAHGWAFNESRPWWQKIVIKFFVWFTIFCSDRTICVSEKTKNDVAALPFINNRLRVVHNGISDYKLLERNTARHALGIHDTDALLIGTLSELHPVKGLDTLLDAWEKFTKKNDAMLVMIGDGDMRNVLKDQVEHLGIADRVIFRGYMDDARQYLSAFDIFCLPSRSEALPYTLLEAGLAERAVIATNVGGIPDVITNGISGALIPPNDHEVLFSTLILLAQDNELRKRLGRALGETVKENFSLEKMVKETLNLY